MTNEEVLAALRLASPAELLHAARVRALGEVTDAGMEAAWPGLTADGIWLRSAVQSLDAVGKTYAPLQQKLKDRPKLLIEDLATLLRGQRPLLRNACRYYLKSCSGNRPPVSWEDIDARVGTEASVQIVGACAKSLSFACDFCHRSFLSKRRLAVHKASVHKIPSAGRSVTFGTCCEVCRTEFWSGARLAEHLRRQGGCRAVYAASDLTPEAIGRVDTAWRPAAAAIGPRPWWATLSPPLEDQG